MIDNRKQKLIDLGPQALTDALLELSYQYGVVGDKIEQLIATPQESLQHFKRKLSSIKRSTRFIDRKDSSNFAHELAILLHNLHHIKEPKIGLRLKVETT